MTLRRGLRGILTSILRPRSPRASARPGAPVAAHAGPSATIEVAPPGRDALRITYAPDRDGEPDAGEIVWTWVPFEEDHSQGKDRPVLVVGHDGPWLLGVQLTSKDHDGRPRRLGGPQWVDIGRGAWDPQRRPSEVRVDRVVRVDPTAVRREGSVLPRDRFELVVAAMRDARG